jgi:hypothetical protein
MNQTHQVFQSLHDGLIGPATTDEQRPFHVFVNLRSPFLKPPFRSTVFRYSTTNDQ